MREVLGVFANGVTLPVSLVGKPTFAVQTLERQLLGVGEQMPLPFRIHCEHLAALLTRKRTLKTRLWIFVSSDYVAVQRRLTRELEVALHALEALVLCVRDSMPAEVVFLFRGEITVFTSPPVTLAIISFLSGEFLDIAPAVLFCEINLNQL